MDYLSVLNLLHVSSAIIWAGWSLAFAWFVMPAAAKAGPAAGPFMGALTSTKLRPTMLSASAVTLVSGILMWVEVVDGAPSGFEGGMLSIGAFAGLAAIAIGHGFQAPTAKKMGGLAAELAGNPPTPEQGAMIAQLQGKLQIYGTWLGWLMIVAVIGMSLGAI